VACVQVAAVDKPKLHMWETGIMRITRHPQAVGQALWCAAHTLWVGNSFMVVTSLGLLAHHLFGCWHGDRRLKNKYGEVGRPCARLPGSLWICTACTLNA
jgi:zeta-carotene isomerase